MRAGFELSTASAFALSVLVVVLGGSTASAEMDIDGDAIPDSTDICPADAGPLELSGCPDSDGDLMPDTFDRCPGEPGETVFAGCPDSDGDLISDPLDECPNEFGELLFAGCPDSDGDLIADPFDLCPDEQGQHEHGGCPDSDADFTPDPFDACPNEPGQPEWGGCPDSDGDLLSHQFDACPDVPGPPEFGGCPDLESIPLGVELGSIQESFGFGSSPGARPEGFELCYGLYDTQNLDLTETAIFDGVVIPPSSLTQTFDLFPSDDPDFDAVASALTSGPPAGTDFGFSVGFFDCIGSGGGSPGIPVAAGATIGFFRLIVPPFSIVEGPGYFEISASPAQLTLSAFRSLTSDDGLLSDSDFDGLPDPFDACPEEPAPAEFGGCGDRDGDRIPDPIDVCPDTPGPFMGCPDSDSDNIPDSSDICPLSWGNQLFGGCPDHDGDGFSQPVDSCPDDPGPLSGCRDRDFDGFMDPVDICLDQPGPFVGCADSDSDGIPDSIDSCPLEAGPFELGGCSDSDADGVLDSIDNCPIHSNLEQTDTDGDGMGDACDADDDDDGLPDGYESDHLCLSALVPDSGGDADEDGLTQLDEFGLGTDPCDPDSDDDGLPDGVEIYGLGAFGTDPLDPDSDGDEALDGSDNCPKQFHEETSRSGFNPDQADLDGDGRGDVCDPDADGDSTPNTFDSCPLANAGSFDADSDGCRDTLEGFVGLVSGLDDLPDSKRKTILSKAAGAEHQVCDVGNVNGGVRKLRDLQNYLRAQSGKSISEATSELLSSYLENLIEQTQAGDDVCSVP
jgi:hypothetical protein